MESSSSQSSEDVDTSELGSLPSVIESVSLAQRYQSDQLSQHQNILQQLKIQLQEELDKVNAFRRELTECEKRHFCQQEDITEQTTACQKLKKEIVKLLEDDFQLNAEIETLQEKLITDHRVHARYLEKIATHKQQALDIEKTNPTQLSLAKQQNLIKQLQLEKQSLLSSVDELNQPLAQDPVVAVKEEIIHLKENKEHLEEQIRQKEVNIQEEHQHQACLIQDISVLKKRNHAQLLRLRNQVKEAQMRNHQWHEEACQLEQQISQLQKIVTEKES